MGEWKTVYADEDGDEGLVVRVTVALIKNLEQNSEQKPLAETDAEDNSITLDPDPVEDLVEELIEIGFSPEAAAWIVGKVPV